MSDEIRLYMCDGGSITVLLRNARLGQGEAGETITTPIPWFLLTHPRGDVIIDGGNAAEAAVDAQKHWGVITEQSTLHMTPDQASVPTLEKLGIDLAEHQVDRPDAPAPRPLPAPSQRSRSSRTLKSW